MIPRAVLWEETFEGYLDVAEVEDTWTVDAGGTGAVAALAFDPVAAGGEGAHLAFAIASPSAGGSITLTRPLVGMSSGGQAEGQLAVQAPGSYAGLTVSVHGDVSGFGGPTVAAVAADGAWHRLALAPLIDGSRVIGDTLRNTTLTVTLAVPAGAVGALRLSTVRLLRTAYYGAGGGVDQAAPVLPLAPSWDGPVVERVAYATDLRESADGTESAAAVGELPRGGLTFTTLLPDAGAALAGLEAVLWGHQAARLAVPRWPDAVTLVEPRAAGAGAVFTTGTTLVATGDDFTGYRFVVGDRALFWRDPETWEAVVVTAVSAAGVSHTAAAQAWGAGTRFVPLVAARVALEQRATRWAPGVAEAEVVAEVEAVA